MRDHAPMILRSTEPRDADELRRIRQTPEVMRWWDTMDVDFPFDEPDAVLLTIEIDGLIVGLIQYWEEPTPQYRHATIDIFLDPDVHGRGHGTRAIRQLVRTLVTEHGHHRITIDPATANTAAIRCYEKVGFKPVGVMRQHERDVDGDGWHDSLLMELLADEWDEGHDNE